MKSENFIAFFTISGFFVGIIFSLLKTQSILDFTIYTTSITLFFYLFVHILLITFFSFATVTANSFERDEYEEVINHQINELKNRESVMNQLIASIKNLKN